MASRQDGSGGGRVLVELIVVVALLTLASRCHYILSLHTRHPGMFSEHLVGSQPLLVALVCLQRAVDAGCDWPLHDVRVFENLF